MTNKTKQNSSARNSRNFNARPARSREILEEDYAYLQNVVGRLRTENAALKSRTMEAWFAGKDLPGNHYAQVDQ